MLETDVALAATSPRVPSKVLERKLLWEGGVVKITIPAKAKEGFVENPEGDICFLQFAESVDGGLINIFLHTSEPETYRGNRITAAIEVWQKSFEDGRAFLFIDLHPVADDVTITHKLQITFGRPGVWSNNLVVFKTPLPQKGAVILSPLSAVATSPKLEAKPLPAIEGADESTGVTLALASGASATEAKVVYPRDPQLKRLLGEGWEIEKEDDQTVNLFKMKYGKRREITHQRAKKK